MNTVFIMGVLIGVATTVAVYVVSSIVFSRQTAAPWARPANEPWREAPPPPTGERG